MEHHFTTLAPCTRAQVYYPVSSQHHIAVMFHHKYGIAAVTQLLERIYQTHIVTLMKPYTRLVKNIQHIYQFGAYLCGQTYSLLLSA